MSVKDIDRGFRALKAELKKVKRSFVKVGVQADETRKDGADAVVVAATHEFGGKNGVPERSFMRTSFDENKAKYSRVIARQIDFVRQHRTVERALGVVGQVVSTDIKKKINSINSPPLDPKTIARRKNKNKSSINILVDTGQMRNSIKSQVIIKK